LASAIGSHRGEEEDDFGDTEKNFAADDFGGFSFPTHNSLIRKEDNARNGGHNWLTKLGKVRMIKRPSQWYIFIDTTGRLRVLDSPLEENVFIATIGLTTTREYHSKIQVTSYLYFSV
jgi:hypothetical protein